MTWMAENPDRHKQLNRCGLLYTAHSHPGMNDWLTIRNINANVWVFFTPTTLLLSILKH